MLSTHSIKKIKQFKSATDIVVLVPPQRFFMFGQGKQGIHRGLVIEGRLPDKISSFQTVQILDGTVEGISVPRDQYKKIEHFDQLYEDATTIVSFDIAKDQMQRLLKFSKENHCTHFRFFRKPNEDAKVRAFDARKYYDQLISVSELDSVRYEEKLDIANDTIFYFYLKVSSLRILPKTDFHVTYYDNGLVDLDSYDEDIVCHMRDQRLGTNFERIIDRLKNEDNLLSLDPRRAEAIRHKIRHHG